MLLLVFLLMCLMEVCVLLAVNRVRNLNVVQQVTMVGCNSTFSLLIDIEQGSHHLVINSQILFRLFQEVLLI